MDNSLVKVTASYAKLGEIPCLYKSNYPGNDRIMISQGINVESENNVGVGASTLKSWHTLYKIKVKETIYTTSR